MSWQQLQENDLTSSSVKTPGSLDPGFGGTQTRKHLMFANEQTSRHPMFANKQASESLKQSGNRIVSKIPASLWRVAGQPYISSPDISLHITSYIIIQIIYHTIYHHLNHISSYITSYIIIHIIIYHIIYHHSNHISSYITIYGDTQ